MTERIRAKIAADITGLSVRAVQAMAARGELPGAAKLGKVWTFDEARLRAWVRQREAVACRPISTGATASGGRGFRFKGATIDAAYERLFSPKRASA